MSLAQRMALFIFGAAAIACVALAFLMSSLVSAPLQSDARDKQLSAARQLMASIDRAMAERAEDIRAIGQDDVLSTAGQKSGAATAQALVAELKAQVESRSAWQQFEMVDASGKIVAASEEGQVGKAGAADSVLAAMVDKALKGQAVTDEPAYNKALDAVVVRFVAPVQDAKDAGKPASVALVGYLAWDSILEDAPVPANTFVQLYAQNGQALVSRAGTTDAPAPNTALRGLAQKATSGRDGIEVVPASGRDAARLAAYVRQKGFDDYGGNGWVLTTSTPTSVAFAGTAPLVLKVILYLVIVISAGAACAVLLVVRVVRPLGILTLITQKIASGDLTQRVPAGTRGEYGQLGASFNSMADKLQQVYEGLERKVVEKTAQLAQKVQEVEAEKVRDDALLSSIGEGMLAVDADGKIAKINEPAIGMFGLEKASPLGKGVDELVTFLDEMGKDPVSAEEKPGFLALRFGQKTEETYQVLRSDQSKIVVAVISSPVRLQGQTIGVIMVVRDVTKEREVDRMKTEFISLASHQLRTPLSAIRWFCEMLLSGDAGPLNKDQTEFAQNIFSSTDRMIQLVSSLLNISRIESGRIIIDPKPTDLKELISGIVNDLHAKIEERNQNLVISVHQDLPKIPLDPRMIGQVYLNLLTNAIKYTPKGGDITVMVSKKDDEIVSQVTDNGYGIPKSQQDRMFQKFFRADNVAKVETDGTGLGMYLVKAIVESSGGKIWFESEEGKGTTFWFSLPAAGMKAKAGEVTLDS